MGGILDQLGMGFQGLSEILLNQFFHQCLDQLLDQSVVSFQRVSEILLNQFWISLCQFSQLTWI